MKRAIIALASACLLSTAAFADGKPTDAEAAKIKEALSAWGCEGGSYEKETEATGVFEIDDAKCKAGGQYDFKLDKDFKVIAVTQD
ncbi:MAG: hypothetical protein NW217_10110 [Hyphomicrobiaceae bacterium]|nr:hypothetical protein [Hyphomicrobiaceae bacterium]